MKKRVFFFLSLFMTIAGICYAGDGDYAVSKVSSTLVKNADAVLRMEDIQIEINSTKDVVEKNHYVITILNENGDKWAQFSEFYDKFNEIISVEGYLYDAGGKQLKKMKYKDLQDLSAVDDISLMDDNRVKVHSFYYKTYPYTIEYQVELHSKTTMFLPSWSPLNGKNFSAEHSRFSVTCPVDYSFRYKAFNYSGEPKVSLEKNKKTTTWEVENLKAWQEESFSPYKSEYTTMVYIAPTDFQMGDYSGNMNTWENLGKFQLVLNAGRDILPDNVRHTIHAMTDTINDPYKKIQVLYEYMQSNTRYISIQLGVGGWQPFEANYVAAKHYGDCKALSNYMYSLLKEAGIRSCYTIIRGGWDERDIIADFPSSQFNHVILCALPGKDSVWLECTNQNFAPGYLGGFTGNRYALGVDDNGGKLIKTPKYSLKENIQDRKIRATLSDDGTLNITSTTKYQAQQQDELFFRIHNLSNDKLKEYLHSHFDLATYNINSFSYKENKSKLPFINEDLDISVSNYATITGKRVFIVPNIITRSPLRLKEDSTRKYNIVLNNDFSTTDTSEIELPAGYEAESKPKDVNISNKFGKYTSIVKLEGNKLYYYRRMEQYSGRFPASDYKDLVSFYESIYKSDRNKVVLVKKE